METASPLGFLGSRQQPLRLCRLITTSPKSHSTFRSAHFWVTQWVGSHRVPGPLNKVKGYTICNETPLCFLMASVP